MPAPRYDVFNGDADGICALHQLRLAEPADSVLVTGVKRDIALLARVPAAPGARVLVLDISLDANAADLRRLLDGGAEVDYYDHHSADGAFDHPRLRLRCDGAADVCTSVLVDRALGGRYRGWAVTAAFGDNLDQAARRLARDMDAATVDALARLGQILNYNAYGECVADLHCAPDALYRAVSAYADPRDFIAASPVYTMLHEGWRADCAQLEQLRPYWQRPGGAVYLLPATPWSRRISGVLANRLAARGDGAAFAVLTERSDGAYLVSVRAGAPATLSACGFCRQFDGGGGRAAAAGINRLPAQQLDAFLAGFRRYFGLDEGLRHAR